jgi:TRAP transporter 4TM/12TM fusion protein
VEKKDIEKSEIKELYFKRKIAGTLGIVIKISAIATSLFILLTGFFGEYEPFIQRPMMVGPCLFIIFLLYPAHRKCSGIGWLITDVILAVLGLLPSVYLAWNWEAINLRGFQSVEVELWLGAVEIILIMEATRRTTGIILPILSLLAVFYGWFGESLPGILVHPNLDLTQTIESIFLSLEGLWGIPTAIMASFIFNFILFGAFLRVTGTGELFVDLAYAVFGKVRGGPSKIAVMGSSLFATISGSSTANVAGTGSFTIPLMKKSGYPAHLAAAIESVASTGGQFTPPVMGASAFIMAEMLGISYLDICIGAAIPAFLYYLCVFVGIDMDAAKMGMKGLPASMLPKFWKVIFDRGYLLISPIILVYFLAIARVSPQKAAIWSILVAIGISTIRQSTRITPGKFVEALEQGCLAALQLVAVCACSGIIIDILMVTGLGMSLSSLLIAVSGGFLIILLILTMFSSLIMGMGLPTMACYILLAILVAPALMKMGVYGIGAHLFVFYYGCMCVITPPVMLAVFVGAAIANADPMKTGLTAVRLGIAGFILPYFWIYAPALTAQGDLVHILWAFITSCVGISAVAISLAGFFLTRLRVYERLIILVGALFMISPDLLTDLIGAVLVGAGFFLHYHSWRSSRGVTAKGIPVTRELA